MPNQRFGPDRVITVTEVQKVCPLCINPCYNFCSICQYCENCCTCGFCTQCNLTVIRQCDVCSLCVRSDFGSLQHCACYVCPSCSERMTRANVCNSCSNCFVCCSCEINNGRIGTRIKFFKSSFRPIRSNPNEFKYNKYKRLVAIELEIDNIDNGENLSDIVKKWGGAIVTDGSLSETGFEINTNPANGDKYFQQIDEICLELEAESASITKRCGFHIHLDAKDYSYYDLRRLIFLYSYIEPALFLLVPPARRSSDYCKPCGNIYTSLLNSKVSPKESKKAIIDNVYGDVIPDRFEKYNLSRRHAFNLHSWFYRGTIECRLMSGTKNASKIKHWSITWLCILNAAMKHKEKEILQLSNVNSFDVLTYLVERHPATKTWLEQRYNKYSKK